MVMLTGVFLWVLNFECIAVGVLAEAKHHLWHP